MQSFLTLVLMVVVLGVVTYVLAAALHWLGGLTGTSSTPQLTEEERRNLREIGARLRSRPFQTERPSQAEKPPLSASYTDALKYAGWVRGYCGSPHRQEHAKFKTVLGYSVRSRAELSIANHLAAKGIAHIYELPVWVARKETPDCLQILLFPDFFLRDEKIFIEFHHNNTSDEDQDRQREKRIFYRENEIPVVWMNEEHLSDIGGFIANVKPIREQMLSRDSGRDLP